MTRVIKSIKLFFIMFFLLFLFQTSFSQTNSIVSIKSYPAGNIPFGVIKQARQFDIKAPFKLLSATVYISDSVGFCVATLALKGNKFDEDFLNHWSRLDKTSAVTLDNIKLIDKSGKIVSLKLQKFNITSN